ncbi:MAG: hypothetical protein R3321_05710 [Nitrososphaeraceae archaeon]|nr:hypothetical protein [Nitrososphaeraceae archaeon]
MGKFLEKIKSDFIRDVNKITRFDVVRYGVELTVLGLILWGWWDLIFTPFMAELDYYTTIDEPRPFTVLGIAGFICLSAWFGLMELRLLVSHWLYKFVIFVTGWKKS